MSERVRGPIEADRVKAMQALTGMATQGQITAGRHDVALTEQAIVVQAAKADALNRLADAVEHVATALTKPRADPPMRLPRNPDIEGNRHV